MVKKSGLCHVCRKLAFNYHYFIDIQPGEIEGYWHCSEHDQKYIERQNFKLDLEQKLKALIEAGTIGPDDFRIEELPSGDFELVDYRDENEKKRVQEKLNGKREGLKLNRKERRGMKVVK